METKGVFEVFGVNCYVEIDHEEAEPETNDRGSWEVTRCLIGNVDVCGTDLGEKIIDELYDFACAGKMGDILVYGAPAGDTEKTDLIAAICAAITTSNYVATKFESADVVGEWWINIRARKE